MANHADILIAFWDGKSPGTMNMIQEMMKCKHETLIVWIGGEAVAVEGRKKIGLSRRKPRQQRPGSA